MIYVRRGFPFLQNQLRVLAYEMAVRNGQRGFRPIKRTAGRYWLKGFPEVKKKMAVNLLIAHVIAVNPTQITKFFDEYKKWLDTWGLNYTPNRIWNVDMCGIGDVPQPTAVVGFTGECTFQTVSGEKQQNTMIVSCVSAGGLAMPPLVIFKANKIKPEWQEAVPTGYMIRGSATGYINGKLFQEFGEHFVRFLTEKKILAGNNKILFLLDMHKLDLFNLGFIEYMKSKNVEVCCFPPHYTHILQPLDDTPFALFKAKYQSQLMHVNRLLLGQRISRVTFFRVLVPAYTAAMTPEAIRSGFKNTGVYPPNEGVEKLKQTTTTAVFDKCKHWLEPNVRVRLCFSFYFYVLLDLGHFWLELLAWQAGKISSG